MTVRPAQGNDGSQALSGLLARGIQARSSGNPRRAARLFTVALNRNPPSALATHLHVERARARLELRQWSLAERDCRRVLGTSAAPPTMELLARCLLEQKRFEEALAELGEAPPQQLSPEGWTLQARALSGAGRHREAVRAAEQAYSVDPTRGPQLGHLLVAAGEHGRNIDFATNWLAQHGNHSDLWAALGTSLNALGQSSRAEKAFRAALRLDPDNAGANWGLGVALLRLGRYEEGFSRNEYRQKAAGNCSRFGVKPWRGESLRGKHLVVRAEQGFGDIAQFVRFLPLVRQRAHQTTLLVRPHMARIFSSNPELGNLRTQHPGFGFGDFQTLVMSLPHCLNLADVGAAPVPYLFPEQRLIDHWRERLSPGPKVALIWQGNPAFAGDAWRSMPFSHYAPLLERFASRVTFLSLQKHFGREQLYSSGLGHLVTDLSEVIDAGSDAFVDSLAVLSLVDLFITTDTGLAHLAGAAGIPTCLLLGHVADWRWGIASHRTPWYPSLRLLRQRRSRDWSDVVAAAGERLNQVLTAGVARPSVTGSTG